MPTIFTYNNNVPFGPNFPGDDQPEMLKNTTSISGLIAVDHVGFNSKGVTATGSGGHHLQVTFDSQNVPAIPADPQAILYTNAGAHPTTSQLFYRNANGIFPSACIRALGTFTTIALPPPLPPPQFPKTIVSPVSFNVSLIQFTASVPGQYTYQATLVPGCISTATPLIIANVQNTDTVDNFPSTTIITSITGSVITFVIRNGVSPTSLPGRNVSFIVIEI